jgi:quinol monooxygenase YgiN
LLISSGATPFGPFHDVLSALHVVADSRPQFDASHEMIIESLDLVARREHRRELQAALCFLVGPSRVESGCVSCQVYQDVANPDGFRFECVWKTKADFIRHLRSEIYKQLLVLMESSAEQPSVQFHTVSETQGLEFVHATRQQEPRAELDDSVARFYKRKIGR